MSDTSNQTQPKPVENTEDNTNPLNEAPEAEAVFAVEETTVTVTEEVPSEGELSAAPEAESETAEDLSGEETVSVKDDAPSNEDVTEESSQALSILQVEEYINQQMKDIGKMREEMKMIKSSVDDTFQNDAQYKEFEEKAKEAAKNKNAYKKQMMNDPAVAELVNKLDGMKAEVKDMQVALSDYLREYNRISGMNQFETHDGEMLEIVNTFKLVKKKD